MSDDMPDRHIDATEKFEKALKDQKNAKRVLKLYVAGNTLKSSQAIAKIHEVGEKHFKGRYDLEVIDIYQQPLLARSQQIIAAPTLIKLLPLPLRRIIGDLSCTERILVGLDVVATEEDGPDQKEGTRKPKPRPSKRPKIEKNEKAGHE
jgi:circadian clock protein KaiB